jgi:hypothetical protein
MEARPQALPQSLRMAGGRRGTPRVWCGPRPVRAFCSHILGCPPGYHIPSLLLRLVPYSCEWTREKTKPPTQRSTQTKATKLAIWVSLLAVAIFFLAGVAGLVWGSLSTVARTGVLLILAIISSAMVVLAWKARRSSADN